MSSSSLLQHRSALRQRGVSLIELMISMTIGLIIMIAVISAYIGASGAGRTAEAIARMNEDGQAALTILTQQLRMAGANPSQPDRWSVSFTTGSARGNSVPLHNSVTNAYAIRGCDDRFTDVTTANSTTLLTCNHTAGSTGPDSISIAYEADRYNTIATAAGVPTDCMGNGITPLTLAPGYLNGAGVAAGSTLIYEAENRFYIGTSAFVINPTLYCRGNGTTTGQPLVENIENLQFSYGTVDPKTTTAPIYVTVTPTFTTTMVLGYLSAFGVDNDVTTLQGAAGTATPARWNAVRAVRVCVVVRSEQAIAVTADGTNASKYLDCTGTLVTPPSDGRLRRSYTTTVMLRNK
ncbi:MAG: PilW family protein [Pseudomonadota bacterium]